MDIRIKFEKSGKLAYLGHLDLMRYFQKALRRAGFPLRYSKGFHPHPIISFAQPLSVGVTSSGEYFDVALSEDIDTDEYLKKINNEMWPGCKVVKITVLPEKYQNAMSLVAMARYQITFKTLPESLLNTESTKINHEIEELLKRDSIIYTKTTKKGERTEDIRPWIYEFTYESGTGFKLCVSTGSSGNLPANVPVEVLLSEMGYSGDDYSLGIHRIDLYMKDGEGFKPLWDL